MWTLIITGAILLFLTARLVPDPDTVLEMALAYMKGIQESGIQPSAKHFQEMVLMSETSIFPLALMAFHVKNGMKHSVKFIKG